MNTGGFPVKKISFITLVLLFVTVVLNFAGYYQVGYQLVSPLITRSVIDKLATPFLIMAITGSVGLIISALFHYLSRYKTALIISLAGIVLPQVYSATRFLLA